MSHLEKFPSGMKDLSAKLNAMGVDLGLWMLANYNLSKQLMQDHPEWYMKNEEGEIAEWQWPGYLLDITHLELWDEYYIPLFEKARNMT